MENATQSGVRAPTIRRFIPAREIYAPRQIAPEPVVPATSSDPFWTLPALVEEHQEATRRLFRHDRMLALGGVLIAAILIVNISLLAYFALSLLELWPNNLSLPFDLAGLVPLLLTFAIRVGAPLLLAILLALAGLAVHRVLTVRPR